jgi:hypothetical protein
VRIRVRIDPPHPIVCRKRRLNGGGPSDETGKTENLARILTGDFRRRTWIYPNELEIKRHYRMFYICFVFRYIIKNRFKNRMGRVAVKHLFMMVKVIN